MSKLVDERVVEMRFDNNNFEKNTRQSMSTIQKLKASLNFSGVSNSLNKSVNSVDMNPITVGLEKAGKSFSAWEVIAITAISNITNRIVDLGIEMTKSLSVDNIASGWSKFTEQTKKTGTIISTLSSTMDRETANKITEEYMEKLMWFSDATSYSLSQMTSSFSTMINKGKDVDTAFKASVGIANWAASAGKSATEVSGVFEALSKVSDHVLAKQWYSIQAANMDTIEFKNAVLESAAAMGMLEKSAERFDGTIEYITKKGHTVTAENFTDYFQDEWFSFDVLLDVLGDYGSSVEKVMKLQEELGLETPYDALDIFTSNAEKAKEEAIALGDAEAEAAANADLFSAKQFKAASEARTLEDAINAVKDAVSTGWLDIFQKVIGTYENATEVFSELADRLVDIFMAPVNAINKSVDKWTEAGGRLDLFSMDENNLGAIWNTIEAIKTFLDIIKQAFKETFKIETTLKDITAKFQEFSKKLILTGDTANNVKNIFKGIFSIFKLGIKIFEGLREAVKPIIKAIAGDAGGIAKILGDIGEKFSIWVDETQIFLKIGSKIGYALSAIIEHLKELQIIDKVTTIFKEFIKQLNLGPILNNVWKSLSKTFDSLFNFLLEALKKILSITAKYIIPALAKVIKYLAIFIGYLGGAILKGIKWLIDRLKDFFEMLRGNESVKKAWTKFINFMKSIPDKLKKLGPFFSKLAYHLGEFFKTLWNGIIAMGVALSKLINFKAIGDFFVWLGEKIAYGVRSIINAFKSLGSSEMSQASDSAEEQLSPIGVLLKGIIDLFKGVIAIIRALIPFIGRALSAIGALFTFIAKGLDNTFNHRIAGTNGISLSKIITGAAVVLFLKWLYDFFFLFKGITSGIADIAYALAFNIRAKGIKLWAEAIKDIAFSLLAIVAAILILTTIDPAKLEEATKTILAIIVTLGTVIGIMGVFLKTNYSVVAKFGKIGNKMSGKFGSQGTGFAGVAGMILAFGLAILAIAGALKIIDSIDKDKIQEDLKILIIIMVSLAAAIGAMNAISNIGAKGGGVRGIKGMLSFALAMLLLLIPLNKIGDMPLNKILKGLFAIIAIMLAYGKTIQIMRGYKAKGMTKLAVFAAGIAALITPIESLSIISTAGLQDAVAVILAISAAFTVLTLVSKNSKLGSTIGLSIMLGTFAGVMYGILALINGPIHDMSTDAYGRFLFITATIIAILYGIYRVLKKASEMKTQSTSQGNLLKNIALFLSIMALTLLVTFQILKVAVYMKMVDWESIGKYFAMLGSLILVATAMIIAAKLMNKNFGAWVTFARNIAILGATLYILSTVFLIMAAVANMMNNVSEDGLFNTLALVAATIVAIGAIYVASKLIKADNQMLENIIAMKTIMIALSVMMLSLALLTSVVAKTDIYAVRDTLLLIVGTLLITFGVVFIASKMKKSIESVALSLMKLGAAFALFGVGTALFASGIQLLMKNVAGLMIFIAMIITMAVVLKLLGAAVPMMLAIAAAFGIMGVAALGIGAAFYLIVLALKELLPILDELSSKSEELTTVISSVISGVINGISNAIPVLVSKVLEALDLVINAIWTKLGKLVQWFLDLDISKVGKLIAKVGELLMTILLTGLDLLANNIKKIIDRVIDIVIGAVYALIERLPELNKALFDFIIEFIESLGQTIEDNAARIRDTMISFCKHLWNAFLNFFGIHSPSKKTEEAGENIILGLIRGIGKNLGAVVKEIVNVGKYMLKEIVKLPKQFLKSGKDLLLYFLDGIKQVSTKVLDFIKSFIAGTIDFVYNAFSKIAKVMSFGLIDLGESDLRSTFKNAGEKTMMAYYDGIESKEMDINQAAKDITQQVVNQLAKTDVYKLIGEHIITEIAYGISENSTSLAIELKSLIEDLYYGVSDAYEDIQENDMLSDAISKLLKFIEEELPDDEIVIKPVMDTSNVEYGVGYIAALLSSVSGVTVATASVSAEKASSEIAQTKAIANASNQVTTTNNQQIAGQNGEVYNLTFNITGPDPKTIADECAKVFYQAINRRNEYAK